MTKIRILTHVKNAAFRRDLRQRLHEEDLEVIDVEDIGSVPSVVAELRPELVLIGTIGDTPRVELDLAQRLRENDPRLALFLLPAQSSETLVIAALRAGVNDYLRPPYSAEEVTAQVTRYLVGKARTHEGICSPSELLLGDGAEMRRIKDYAAKAALSDCNILITGETGTGKELFAHLIHSISSRSREPLVCVNCAAIPDTLLESELYGHEKGAFTGANEASAGLLKRANGGTLFLDEIGDMSLQAQAKVLRAIESKEILPLGSKKPVRLDIRIITATNQELESMVAEKRFRKDLFFRLKVAHVKLPPLRERKEDIPRLLRSFVQSSNRKLRRQVEGFDDEALALLLQYDWPGNVRELRNLVEACFITLVSSHITPEDLPAPFPLRQNASAEDEKTLLLSALASNGWNKSKAAVSLKWSRMTIYRKLAKYGIPERADSGASANTF
jgi:DNA-binding NtrC family response regulator